MKKNEKISMIAALLSSINFLIYTSRVVLQILGYNSMKKRHVQHLFILCIALHQYQSMAITIDTNEIQDLNAFDDPALEQKITRSVSASPSDCLSLLYRLKVNQILKNNIYNYTFPLAQRQLFTYPSVMQFTPQESLFGLNLIYQETTTLLPFCNGIAGYIGLFNKDFIQSLDISLIREGYNINIPDFIELLKNGRAEQRRVGFLFDAFKRINRFCIGLEVPLYFAVRNYNLPLEDQQEIKSSPIIPCSSSDSSAESAYHKYVVDTRVGLGDSQLTFGTFLSEKDRYNIFFGAKIILPTAAAFATGFIGSNFSKLVDPIYMDLQQIIDDALEEKINRQQIQDLVINYAKHAIYQANAILLKTDLGEMHRWQAGIFLQPILHLNDQVTLATHFRLNWALPVKTTRFIIDCVNPTAFADSNFDPDQFPPAQKEQLSTNALTFLSNRLENVVFPPCYAVHLGTQSEAQITIGPWIHFTDSWHFFIGYDYWHKEREHALSWTACQDRVHAGACGICIDSALVPTLTEHKLALKCSYKKYKDSHNLLFDFGADFPMVCQGIGPTYTGFIKITWEF